MKPKTLVIVCSALLILTFCMIPAGAVILEVTVRGTIADLSPADNTLTIAGPSQYGCDFGSGTSEPVCSWTPMNITTLTGTVPDAAAFQVFARNDTVVAVSLGGTGGTWIALAKTYSTGTATDYATDEVGNIGSLPTPLIGDYTVSAVTVPDCSACTGTSCTAVSSNVTISSGQMTVAQKVLRPGESLFFKGRNDDSSVNVTFVNGQALADACPGNAGLIGGVQPVSDYIVRVVPPVGMNTAAMASPAEPVSGVPSATTTTPQSSLPSAVLSVLGLAIAAIAACRIRE
ncbi:hypothetical protein [Methanoregula sp.]|uniref:hypothetical protein n=1 Tax=Methanoregula sp. TaxID=2052170 RepID=UPI002C7BA96C|nr:hypothetical protein [Methanoregula sp.]HVP95956.1 hypothetical protein [Methanoregula sp.]